MTALADRDPRGTKLSLFCELLHRKRSHGLSLFSKREYDKVGRELEQRRNFNIAASKLLLCRGAPHSGEGYVPGVIFIGHRLAAVIP